MLFVHTTKRVTMNVERGVGFSPPVKANWQKCLVGQASPYIKAEICHRAKISVAVDMEDMP